MGARVLCSHFFLKAGMKRHVFLLLIVCNSAFSIQDPYARSALFYDIKNPFYAANCLFDSSEYDAAIVRYLDVLQNATEAYTGEQKQLALNALGQAYRALGDFQNGYTYIAHAFNAVLKKPLKKKIYTQLTSKQQEFDCPTLLVRCTDDTRRFGIGDMLGDAVYLKRLTQMNSVKTVALVAPSLKKLYENAHCASVVISPHDAVPHYDYETFLALLPHFFGIKTPDEIPQEPVFIPRKEDVLYWEKYLDTVCGDKMPLMIWHMTSDFPVPEGRKLRSRKIPLAVFESLRSDSVQLISVSYGHPPITIQEYELLDQAQREEQGFDVVSEAFKREIIFCGDLNIDELCALGQAIVNRKGYLCGPDTAIPNGLAYAIQSDIRRIAVFMPYHNDARWGVRPGSSIYREGRFPNVLEFWQQEADNWSAPMDAFCLVQKRGAV